MVGRRLLLTAVGGLAVLFFARPSQADSLSIFARPSPHFGIGFSIGDHHPYYPPMHGRFYRGHPWEHRFVRIGPPPVVIVQPPVEPVVITPPPVEQGTVTVWITNSNGSTTPVTLTRQGYNYIGPRGEYYSTMPSNEQLRMVYGF
jgi:hypothetical protein